MKECLVEKNNEFDNIQCRHLRHTSGDEFSAGYYYCSNKRALRKFRRYMERIKPSQCRRQPLIHYNVRIWDCKESCPFADVVDLGAYHRNREEAEKKANQKIQQWLPYYKTRKWWR